MILTIIILSLVIVALGFTTYNLLKKNEKCEDIIISYENYVSNLSKTIDAADKKLKEVDARGLFESDDEIGFFFQEVKTLQEKLNDFKASK